MKNVLLPILACIALAFGNIQAQTGPEINPDGIIFPKLPTPPPNLESTEGQIIYNTSLAKFQTFDGSAWVDLTSTSSAATDKIQDLVDGDTRITAIESGSLDRLEFRVEGTNRMALRNNTAGFPRFEYYDPGNNTSYGDDAGLGFISGGTQNALFGNSAGEKLSTGDDNVFVGFDAGRFNEEGSSNVALGSKALRNNITATNNVAIGQNALTSVNINQTSTFFGSFNTAIGSQSMADGDQFTTNNTSIGYESGKAGGNNSVMVGYQAGFDDNNTGSVMIGHKAGSNTSKLKDNALFIANDEGTPLIYGQFNNDYVEVNGNAQIRSEGTLNTFDKTLQLSSNGNRPALVFTNFSNEMSIEFDARSNVFDKRLHINDASRLPLVTVTEDGDVGIGETDPEAKLHIGGINNESLLLMNNGGDVKWKSSSGTITNILSVHTDDNSYLAAIDDLVLRTNVGSNRLTIQKDGDVIIADLAGTGNGDVMVGPSGQLFRSTSDRRLKEDIKPIEHALDKILHMDGVSYFWKNQPRTDRTLGVIAQDVMKVVPDIVSHDGEYYGVNYSEIPALLIEAMKEQQKIIDAQKQEITDIKNSLTLLSQTVSVLQSKNENSPLGLDE